MFITPIVTAALAVAFAAPVTVPSSTYFTSLLPTVGSTAKFHIAFDGHFWNGQKRAFQHDVALARTGSDALTSTVTGPDLAAPEAGAGTVAANGRLTAADGRNRFASFNAVAAMIAGAPAAPKAGDSWTSRMPVDTNDVQWVEIPVTVKVASADGDRIVLQVTGTASDTMTYSGFTMPIDVNVRGAASFANRVFSRADFAVEEVVHAGPQTQSLGWQWSLEPR
ncbi:MAG TPA: hypothetical protein VGC72_18685 [Candidatus Elarobacter sp.]|jgi:hypothetical protein